MDVALRKRPVWLQLTGRQFAFVGSILALLLVAAWVVVLRPWEENVLDRYQVRLPTSVPVGLLPLDSGGPLRQARPKAGTGLWNRKDWCVESRDPCVVLWQGAWELDIQTEGKTPFQVDGVTGWLWRLDRDVFVEDPTVIAGDEWLQGNSLKQALAERFDSLPKAIGRAYLYFDAAGSRHGEFGRLSGPALAIQWNKDKQHYLLIGERRAPITEDVLRTMADSLVAKEEPSSR